MTRYEEWKARAKGNVDAFQTEARLEGLWDFKANLKILAELQSKMNHRLMVSMFGEDLGDHYFSSYRNNGSNILNWVQRLDDEALIYVLHQVKTNPSLYVGC